MGKGLEALLKQLEIPDSKLMKERTDENIGKIDRSVIDEIIDNIYESAERGVYHVVIPYVLNKAETEFFTSKGYRIEVNNLYLKLYWD